MFRSSCKSTPTIRTAPSLRIPLRLPSKSQLVIRGRSPISRVTKRSYSTVISPKENSCSSKCVSDQYDHYQTLKRDSFRLGEQLRQALHELNVANTENKCLQEKLKKKWRIENMSDRRN